MGITASYLVWFTIRITHEYYSGNKNGIELLPAGATMRILQKEGIIMRHSSNNTWTFLRQGGTATDSIEMKDGLEFYMKPVDAGFYYFTCNDNQAGAGWQVKEPDRSGAWKVLAIGIDGKVPAANTAFDITLGSAKKFLEFIVITKVAFDNNWELAVNEDRDRIKFTGSKINFPGEALPVFRFVTTEPVPLREIYDYRVALCKHKDNAQTLLGNTMPFPKPASVSVISPKDTISSYFYF